MAVVTDRQAIALGVIALIGAAFIYWQGRKLADSAGEVFADARETMGDAVNKVNPASRENILYSGVNWAGGVYSGNENWDLGGAIYDGVNWVRGLWGDSDADRQQALIKQWQQAQTANDPNTYETVASQ